MHTSKDEGTILKTSITKEFDWLDTISKDNNGKEKHDAVTAKFKDYSGSDMTVTFPDYSVWDTGTQLFPFVFTSDSDWTVDVCLSVPTGYNIQGVLDDAGNVVPSTGCTQALIAGEPVTALFSVVDVGSPEPNFTFTIHTIHTEAPVIGGSGGQLPPVETMTSQSTDGIRQATKAVVDTQITQAVASVVAQIAAQNTAAVAQAVTVLKTADKSQSVVIAQAPAVVPQTTQAPTASQIAKAFQKTLVAGVQSEDVRALQVYLNSHGFTVSTTGPGSKGNESNYFGAKTKAALKAFQEAYAKDILSPLGLSKGTGILGTKTREYINSHQ